MTYRVYQRAYERALVLYKPLMHKPGDWKTQAALGAETATEHDLGERTARYAPTAAWASR